MSGLVAVALSVLDVSADDYVAIAFLQLQRMIAGAVFTIAGTWTAPCQRLMTAAVLVGISVVLSVTVNLVVPNSAGWTNVIHVVSDSVGSLIGKVIIHAWLQRLDSTANGGAK
ncbi:MAG: hypothetical protein HKN47_20285 [Pirellulaceae bacterium]|nr:hypothetical protein [Pirellulaceae bacterium]